MFAQPAAAWGFLPGPVALAELQELTRIGLAEAEVALAPVPTTQTLVLLSVGGIGLVALTVDTIGVTLRLPALAGIPLLLVFALPAAVVRGGPGHLERLMGKTVPGAGCRLASESGSNR